MSRRVGLLLLACFLLAVVRGWLWVLHVEAPGEAGELVLEFDPASVQAVELARGEQTLVLERAGEEWVVASAAGVRARSQAAQDLVLRLWTWRKERRAASDASQHAEFGVSREQARRVRLLGAAEASGSRPLLGEVWVGRVTGVAEDVAREEGSGLDTGRLGVFVRARRPRTHETEPGPVVWVVNEFVTHLLDPTPSRWIAHPLLAGRPEEVDALELGRGPDALELGLRPRFEVRGRAQPLDPVAVRQALAALYLVRGIGARLGSPPADALELGIRRGEAREAVSLWAEGERWFLASQGAFPPGHPPAVVELDPRDAVVAARLGQLGSLLRRRLVVVPTTESLRVFWRADGRERLFQREREGWSLVQTGESQPLRTARLAPAALEPALGALAALEVARWEPSETARPARARLALRGAWGEVAWELVDLSPEQVALQSADFPGYVAWVARGPWERAVAALPR